MDYPLKYDNRSSKFYQQNGCKLSNYDVSKYNSSINIKNNGTSKILPLHQNKKIYTSRNIISLKKIIFPQISDDKLSDLMIDDESIKYITFKTSAQEITNIIMNNLIDYPCPYIYDNNRKQKWNSKSLTKKMKNLVITEMTAGVGGNVLNFAKYFKYVNAIEIDPDRCFCLNNNVKLYELDNVNCYNDNSIQLLISNDDIIQDIVFFDPPWGGQDYKLFYNLKLKFGEYSIENICCQLFKRPRTKIIAIKLPINYDFGYLISELSMYKVSKYILDRMAFIIVKNYNID